MQQLAAREKEPSRETGNYWVRFDCSAKCRRSSVC